MNAVSPQAAIQAAKNDINFPRWQKSPPGLSAQGFKKIGKVEGGQEALQSFRTAKKP